jgi:stage III sporulation protein SpoIIIAA
LLAANRRGIVDDLEVLVDVLPQRLQVALRARKELSSLLEVVLDLGRKPVARFPGQDVVLDQRDVTQEELFQITSRIGAFGDDNRAGIERTLHRFSAIRNRAGKVVGMTCRVGRAVYGTIRVIEDLVPAGKSILMLGRPGVGKTTMLREVARVLADEVGKRVVIVDTSNEIAGDGDIPHPAIGRARRMQVPTPSLQHAVMIEAVENHMPEVIIIDEMGTELEAVAARTIAERGVQLVATAHGNTLQNLVMNPTLSDLVGGIQSVTLGDDEARRRGTRKSVLERKAPPTFDMVVEIQSWSRVAFHRDVARTVDVMLQGIPPRPEVRWIDESGEVRQSDGAEHEVEPASVTSEPTEATPPADAATSPRIFPFGVSRDKLAEAARQVQINMQVVGEVKGADLVLTTKNHYRKGAQALTLAEELAKPVYVLRKNTAPQLEQFLLTVSVANGGTSMHEALQEVEDAAGRVMDGEASVELQPQGAYVRRLQHQMAKNYNIGSRSVGRDPNRRVTISQTNGRD